MEEQRMNRHNGCNGQDVSWDGPRDSSVYLRIELYPAGLFLSSLASTLIERRYKANHWPTKDQSKTKNARPHDWERALWE
jgi:hypothetical protein